MEALQHEAESVAGATGGLLETQRAEMAEQQETFTQLQAEDEAWRQEVEQQILPLEVADRKFRPLLQEKSRAMQLEEQQRRDAQQRRKMASATKAGAVDHKAEASSIAASIKKKMASPKK